MCTQLNNKTDENLRNPSLDGDCVHLVLLRTLKKIGHMVTYITPGSVRPDAWCKDQRTSPPSELFQLEGRSIPSSGWYNKRTSHWVVNRCALIDLYCLNGGLRKSKFFLSLGNTELFYVPSRRSLHPEADAQTGGPVLPGLRSSLLHLHHRSCAAKGMLLKQNQPIHMIFCSSSVLKAKGLWITRLAFCSVQRPSPRFWAFTGLATRTPRTTRRRSWTCWWWRTSSTDARWLRLAPAATIMPTADLKWGMRILVGGIVWAPWGVEECPWGYFPGPHLW